MECIVCNTFNCFGYDYGFERRAVAKCIPANVRHIVGDIDFAEGVTF